VRILIIGPPGAGKGTQAALLSAELGIPHISTGDLFRAHVEAGTELGREVKKYLDAGALVPDEITNAMVTQRLAEPDCRAGFLLDGFPRTLGQAKVLEAFLREQDGEIDAVLQLDVPDQEVLERLLSRGRDDDTEKVIRRRQRLYREETAPLLDFYADRLITVPAVGAVAEVTARALDALRARA
jgi:adenylate kinase